MKNKKGQFFLVAAIIIVLAVSGIASVKTYAVVKSEPRKVQDIGRELREETVRIIDYGIIQEKDLEILIERDFLEDEFGPYFLQKTQNTAIVFVYGNKMSLKGVRYKEDSTGKITSSIGGSSNSWDTSNTYLDRVVIDTSENQDIVSVTISGKSYDFKIRDNEMFYFVILEEKDGEIYVERN